MKFILTEHVRLRMSLRGITEKMIEEALSKPDRTALGYSNRLLAYKKFDKGTIKVVYTIEEDTPVIITVIWD